MVASMNQIEYIKQLALYESLAGTLYPSLAYANLCIMRSEYPEVRELQSPMPPDQFGHAQGNLGQQLALQFNINI